MSSSLIEKECKLILYYGVNFLSNSSLNENEFPIIIKNLTKSFQSLIAVKDISFSVKKQEILGVWTKWRWKNNYNSFIDWDPSITL